MWTTTLLLISETTLYLGKNVVKHISQAYWVGGNFSHILLSVKQERNLSLTFLSEKRTKKEDIVQKTKVAILKTHLGYNPE